MLGRWANAAVVLAEQVRFALGDPTGAALDANAVVVTLGERLGLPSARQPGPAPHLGTGLGCSDVERNCISNVQQQGVAPALIAGRLAWLLDTVRDVWAPAAWR